MAYCVVDKKIAMLGFCCSLSYFHAVRNQDTMSIAKELGVTCRTIRAWRAAYRADKIPCANFRGCFFKNQKEPERCLDSNPVPAVGRGRVLGDELSL